RSRREAQGSGRRARAAARRGGGCASLAGVGAVDGRSTHARRLLALEPWQGSLLGTAANRARLRGGVRSPAGRSLPPRDDFPAVAAGQTTCGMSLRPDRKSTRLNSSHVAISYAVF